MHDSPVSHALFQALTDALPVYGDRGFFLQALGHLKASNEAALASAEAAGRAYRAFSSGANVGMDSVSLKLIQNLKISALELLLWRCAAVANGIQSHDAMLRAFQQAVPDDVDNIIGSLSNARRNTIDNFRQYTCLAQDQAEPTSPIGSYQLPAGTFDPWAGLQQESEYLPWELASSSFAFPRHPFPFKLVNQEEQHQRQSEVSSSDSMLVTEAEVLEQICGTVSGDVVLTEQQELPQQAATGSDTDGFSDALTAGFNDFSYKTGPLNYGFKYVGKSATQDSTSDGNRLQEVLSSLQADVNDDMHFTSSPSKRQRSHESEDETDTDIKASRLGGTFTGMGDVD